MAEAAREQSKRRAEITSKRLGESLTTVELAGLNNLGVSNDVIASPAAISQFRHALGGSSKPVSAAEAVLRARSLASTIDALGGKNPLEKPLGTRSDIELLRTLAGSGLVASPDIGAGSPPSLARSLRQLKRNYDNSRVANPLDVQADIKSMSQSSAESVAVHVLASDQSCGGALGRFQSAVRNLRTYADVEEFVTVWYQNWLNGKPLTVNALELTARRAAFSYFDECLASPARITAGGPDISKYVGALGSGAAERFCTATRVKRNVVLTARHCVMRTHNGRTFGLKDANALRTLWFEYDADEKFRYAVCGYEKVSTRDEYSYGDDVVLLKIAATRDEPPPLRLATRRPRVTDDLYMPALNLIQVLRDESFSLATSKVSGCRIVSQAGVCALHGCQSLPGSSGAPLFVRGEGDAGRLALAGIHLGGHNERFVKQARCVFDQSTPNTPNISMDLEVLKAFIGEQK